MRMMSRSNIKQRRLNWLSPGLRVSGDSDVLFFVGCLPYFGPLFRYTGAHSLNIARSTIRVLNYLGIEPIVLADERCCGQDLLATGDLDGFSRLAEHNLSAIKASGASLVVTACPECLVTLSTDYPKYAGRLGLEVVHISQLLAREVTAKGLSLGHLDKKVTYQDPCRLSRHAGAYEEPRAVLSAIEGLALVEMEHSGTRGVCCGTQSWMNCGAVSKAIQTDRLREAVDTGASLLVTACPKCQIHLKCAQLGAEPDGRPQPEVVDLMALVARTISSRITHQTEVSRCSKDSLG
jgi:Fe-S oxidoreductase